jgi:hypothetical protein
VLNPAAGDTVRARWTIPSLVEWMLRRQHGQLINRIMSFHRLISGWRFGRERLSPVMEEGNSIVIHYKNFCKCHDVPFMQKK